jgi:tRNA threonylcarbamoyladenosine modification (KEOPS) complex  Pcc1 subunit
MDTPDDAVLAVIKIELTEKLLGVIEIALVPEAETPSSDRSNTKVMIEDNNLVIQTQASDTTALRASLNSYLRWVDGIQNIVESIE